MRAASAGKYARALIGVAASRGRAAETAELILRAAEFFGPGTVRSARRNLTFVEPAAGETAGGDAAALLQSSRVPRDERARLLDEIAEALSLNDETMALVEAFASARALRSLPAVAARAGELARQAAPVARAELRTAFPLSAEALGRIRDAASRALARPDFGELSRAVELDVVEDADLIGGVVLRSGNRIWDGSIAGQLASARDALRL